MTTETASTESTPPPGPLSGQRSSALENCPRRAPRGMRLRQMAPDRPAGAGPVAAGGGEEYPRLTRMLGGERSQSVPVGDWPCRQSRRREPAGRQLVWKPRRHPGAARVCRMACAMPRAAARSSIPAAAQFFTERPRN